MARETAPEARLVRADALALPFPPRSFDLALCALAFHHLGFEASARVLAGMDRLTTRGFVVSDLRRDRPTLWGVRAAMALVRAHPFTRHDAPASVRRAFTPAEYRRMVGLSGVQGVRLHAHWYFRVALVQDKKLVQDKNG
jgi:ubiquinone/menaquinone biosynthesis C-methylase UbiE